MKKNQTRNFASILFLSLMIYFTLSTVVMAKVVRVEITSREVISDLPELSRSGPYEIIKGTIYLEVNPDDPANKLIVDLKYAPRNSRGNVEFDTEFELHKPVDAGRGNHRLIYFVNNRGYRMAAGYSVKYGGREIPWGHFNAHAGKNWLYSQGWSFLWSGWNCDVIEHEQRLNIHIPVATDNGKPITGKVYAQIYSYSDDITYSHPLVWGGSIPYPPVSMDNKHARLTMQQYPWDKPVEIPRSHWSFARFENGKRIPDPGFLYIKEGFKPGWLYDLVYMGKDPKPTGLGMASIRDVVSFFKYEKADEKGNANPLADVIEHAYSWGHSQSGRLLFHFLWQNFNGDEQKKKVFDGIMSNCPGAGKGQFNSRFAQTTRHGSHLEDNLYPIDFFPFTTVEQYDPVTGQRGDSLSMAREAGFLPKIFFINTSTDYWTRAASLLHTDVEGKQDAGIDPNVRIYFVAGRAHVDGEVGIIGRALLTALDQWVSMDIEPPESQIPKIADGTLVELEAFRKVFPAIPGIQMPGSYYHPYRLDPGPRWHSEGIADNVPPKAGPRYVCLVPQVNEEGIEIAGIHLPEIVVPISTFTGWSMRNPSFSRTLRRNAGTRWPLPRTAEERKQNNDPRKSIAERYTDSEDYLVKVTEQLLALRRQRFLLDEDFARLLDKTSKESTLIKKLDFLDEVAVEKGADAAWEYYKQLEDAFLFWWFDLGPEEYLSRINAKGMELQTANKLETALEVFKLNTLIFPDNSEVWNSLADCYYAKRDLESALKYYEKCLELNPGNEDAKGMIERIKKGKD